MLRLLKRHRIVIIIATVLVSAGVALSMRAKFSVNFSFLYDALATITFPVQEFVHNSTSSIGGLIDDYVVLINTQTENKRLIEENKLLNEKLNQYENDAIQFKLLREQLDFPQKQPLKSVYSEIVGESVENFNHILIINRGSQAGIKRNYPVIVREGVVGRIETVSPLRSTVQLITDRRHRFPVLVRRTRDRMVVVGNNDDVLLIPQDKGIAAGDGLGLAVDRIRKLAEIKVGDEVITSGMAGIFPKGLLVGTIEAVQSEQHELFKNATVDIAVNFNRIENVYVLLPSDNDE